jgi:hypothetical protein
MIISINCKAQTIVDINNYNQGDNTNKYFKDLNGQFNQFIGTWENTTGNKTFRLTLQKDVKVAFGYPTKYYCDVITGKFILIEDAGEINEVILCNSDNFPSKEFYPYKIMMGSTFGNDFGGRIEDVCATTTNLSNTVSGIFKLSITNPGQSSLSAHWTLNREGTGIETFSFSLPQDVILTKVN